MRLSVSSLVMLILVGCSYYEPESKAEYDRIMLSGEVISSSTAQNRLTTSIVKLDGQL